MDVDPPSSSRLSVLCSTSAEYSSNSSEGSSPNSRRSSMNESIIKDESYWERRRKNNDASRRSREKRRLGDLAMEQKLLQLSQENERLKTQLESRAASAPDLKTAHLPSSALASALGLQSTLPTLPLSTTGISSISTSVLPPLLPPTTTNQLPMLQLAQLAAIQQQVGGRSVRNACHPSGVVSLLSAAEAESENQLPLGDLGQPGMAIGFVFQYNAQLRPSCVFSTGSAFVPFHKESVIMRTERTSPDSSSDRKEIRQSAVIRRVPSPLQERPREQQPQPQPQQSILGVLLSTRRTSPTVPQSRTEHLGLGSPPRGSKSDCESISSSASFSPSHSSEDQMDLTDPAIRQALGEDKSIQYMDRRRRNNEAAKRCRANRRAVFEYRSRRVQMLESENDQLKEEIDRLKKELDQQRALLATLNRDGI